MGYWDSIRQCFFGVFNLSIITVITILPEKGQNTRNTTFVHRKNDHEVGLDGPWNQAESYILAYN